MFLTIHLLCAIIFLGYIFCGEVLPSPIRKIFWEGRICRQNS
ncbi:hypothetical protein [Helicobacter ganmani]